VGLGVGLGVAVGLGVGVAVGFAVGFGVAVGRGVGVAVGFAVAVGRGVGLAVGFGVAVGRGIRVAVGFGVGVAVGRGVGFTVGLGVGVAVGFSVSKGFNVGKGVLIVGNSSVSVSAALAEDIGVGEMIGLGGTDSSSAGVLCLKGVDAASCARTKDETARNRIAKANKRMGFFRLFSRAELIREASPRSSGRSSRIESGRGSRTSGKLATKKTK